MTSPEVRWIENDLKVELFALKIKNLREEYLQKNPNADRQKVDNYINRKLKAESDSLFKEQLMIISDAGLP